MHVSIAKRQFDDPYYAKRFEVVEAMSYAGSGDYVMADSVISKFLKANPSDTLTSWASTVKEYIKEVRNGGKPSWYKEGPPPIAGADSAKATPAVAKAAPSTGTTPKTTPAIPPSEVPSKYAYQADSSHYCMVVLPGLDSKTAGLKQAIKDLNQSNKYAAANLDVLLDLYNINQGVLIVRKFNNVTEAKNYMNDLLSSDAMHGYSPGELKVLVITASNYKKMFSDKDTQPYFNFYNTYYQ